MPQAAAPHNHAARIDAPRAGAFRSRIVKSLKILFPLLALVIIGGAVLWPRDEALIPITVEKIDIEGDRIAMQQSSYRGTTDAGEPFNVEAQKISQAITKPGLFEMEQITASIGSKKLGTVMMTAPSGRYNHDQRELMLLGLIAINSDKGYTIEAGDTRIDLAMNEARSDQPVRAHGPMGEIQAGNMRIVDGADRILFGGGVQLKYRTAKSE